MDVFQSVFMLEVRSFDLAEVAVAEQQAESPVAVVGPVEEYVEE